MTNTKTKNTLGMTREHITKELIKNDYKMLNEFINGHVDEKYFLKKYKTTRQHFYNIVTAVDPDVYEKRKEREKNLYRDLYNQALEGIAFEEILKDKEKKELFTASSLNEIKVARSNTLRNLKKHGIIEDSKEGKFLLIDKKVKAYTSSIQIGKELERYVKSQHMLLTSIAARYDASYQKVQMLKERIVNDGQPLPKLPKSLIDVIERNIEVCKLHRDGQTLKEIGSRYDISDDIVQKILNSYDPYVI